MEIKPNTPISDIKPEKLSSTEKLKFGTIAFFDTNNDGNLDENEASIFNSAIVKTDANDNITITYKKDNKEKTETFKNLGIDKGKKYYENGAGPRVAVIDVFSGGNPYHGHVVANSIKEVNPNISVHRFDCAPLPARFSNWLAKNPEIDKFLYETGIINWFKDDLKPISAQLKNIKQEMDNGTKFSAINLSQGVDISINDINTICKEQDGIPKEGLTPENIATYRDKIKEILKNKINNGEIKTLKDQQTGNFISSNKILEIINAMEELSNTPIYVAQAYKSKESQNNFNIFSLASNARTCSGETKGKKDICSKNSFVTDSRIKYNLVNQGGELSENTSSYSTPIVLAKEAANNFKNQGR